MTTETITLETARLYHPTAEVIEVIARGDDGLPAIYVWETEADAADDDGARATALYWLLDK